MKRHRSTQLKIVGLFILLEIVAHLTYMHITQQEYNQELAQDIKVLDEDTPALVYDVTVKQIHDGNLSVADYVFNQAVEKHVVACIQLAMEWDLSLADFNKIESRAKQESLEAKYFRVVQSGVTIFAVDHNEKECHLSDDLYAMILRIYCENELHGNIVVKVHDVNQAAVLAGICLTCVEYANSARQILQSSIPYHVIHVYADLERKPIYEQRAILEHALLHCQQFHKSTIESIIHSILEHNPDAKREELIQSSSFIKFLRSLERFADRLPAAVKDLDVVHMMEKYYMSDDEEFQEWGPFFAMREKKRLWVRRIRRLREAEVRLQQGCI